MPSILGPDGNPVRKETQNFSIEVEAFIESKVNTAMDNARTQLRSDIDTKGQRQLALYVVTVCVSLLFAFNIAPQYIEKWTRQFVENKMTEPTLKEVADNIIKTKMEGYIESQIKPLTNQAEGLSDTISRISEEINLKQSELSKYFAEFKDEINTQQTELTNNISKLSEDTNSKQEKLGKLIDGTSRDLKSKQLKIESLVDNLSSEINAKQREIVDKQDKIKTQLDLQQSSIAAKAGSLKDYNSLLSALNNDKKNKNIIEVLLKEIELFYDSDRSNLSFQVLVDKSTHKDPGYSTGEILYEYHNGNDDMRVAAINTLFQKNDVSSVGFICKSTKSESNLRVLARMTKTFNQLTKETLKPLEYQIISNWWDKNKNEEKYQSDYKDYFEVRDSMLSKIHSGNNISFADVALYSAKLNTTIKYSPHALHARCLRGGFLTILGSYDEARKEFEAVRKENSNYRWLKVWESALLYKTGKEKEAIELAKSAYKDCQSVEGTIRYWNIFAPYRDDIIKSKSES